MQYKPERAKPRKGSEWRPMSQAELLAEAAQTEIYNIQSLKHLLAMEVSLLGPSCNHGCAGACLLLTVENVQRKTMHLEQLVLAASDGCCKTSFRSLSSS